MSLPNDSAEVREALQRLGSKTAVADHYEVSEATVRRRCKKDGITFEATEAKALPEETSDAETALARKAHAADIARSTARAEAKAVKDELKEVTAERDRLSTALALVAEVESVKKPDWLQTRKRQKAHHGTLLAAFSDYHIGEVVDPAEMNDYNAYNPDIAEQRVRRFFEKTILLSREYLAGVKYDGVVVPSLGDTISGSIHEELNETNGLSNFQAVPLAVAWIEEGLGILADEFGKVHMPCVPGNHPRDRKQPRYKGRSEHNADTLISNLVAQRFKNDDRVTFDIPASLDVDFSIYGTRFRAEHGDEVKGSGGGVQGPVPAVTRFTHKRRHQAQQERTPFDYLFIGHLHQLLPLLGTGFIINGSGKGYDEYARGNAFSPEPPQQFLGVVTPERGLTAQYPLFVAGKRKAEGW